MNTRLFLLKLTATLAAIICGGCMSPKTTADVVDDDVVVDPVTPDTHVSESSVSVSMPPEQFASLSAWLGHKNSVVIENPVHVQQDAFTLDAKAGTKFSYDFGDDSGTITFNKPYPTVKAGLAKLIGGTSLHELALNSDGSGLASTGLGRYRIRWMDEDDSGSAASGNELPEVWAYSQPGCPPCVRARLELAAEKELPFRVVWRDDPAPDWLKARPAFWWHTSGNQPRQDDVNNTRQSTGWNGIKDFIERWKGSRSPKRFQRSAATSTSYHSGHDCPKCGREQYSIKNNNGPAASTHTHQCNACGTAWYHRDQTQASAGKSRQFLWWNY